jgi:predicted DNA-binding transcriptional regulator AlpA
MSCSHTTADDVLLDVKGVAHLLKCSERHVRRLADSRQMPRPLNVGRLSRWRLGDIRSWVAAGCPKCSRTTKAKVN